MGEYKKLSYIFLILIIISLFSLNVFSVDDNVYTCKITDSSNKIFTCRETLGTPNEQALCTSQNGVFVSGHMSTFNECNQGCCCAASVNTNQRLGTRQQCYLKTGTGSDSASGFKKNESITTNAECSNVCFNTQALPLCQDDCSPTTTGVCDCGGRVLNATRDGQAYCCAKNEAPLETIFSTESECKQSIGCKTIAGYYIAGRVLNSTGGPVSNVKLDVQGSSSAFSDTNGYYNITPVMANSGTIFISKSGYRSLSRAYVILGAGLDGNNINILIDDRLENCVFDTSDGMWDADYDGRPAKFDWDCGNKPITGANNPNYLNESARGLCSNNYDDDGDGLKDCEDPGCKVTLACTNNAGALNTCGDGKVGSLPRSTSLSGTSLSSSNSFALIEKCDVNNSNSSTNDNPTLKYPGCASGETCLSCTVCRSNTAGYCGNGILDAGERCDFNSQSLNHGCPSSYTCSQSCDCVSNALCGDGVVNLSSEQCDFIGGSIAPKSICSASQCIPPGKPGACLCLSNFTCGNHQLDSPHEQCDVATDGTILGTCASGDCDQNSCTCKSCNALQKSPVLIYVKNTSTGSFGGANLSWRVDCPNPRPQTFTIKWCIANSSTMDCTPKTPIAGISNTTLNYTHSFPFFVNSSSTVCYSVLSVYGAQTFESQKICILTPQTPECTGNKQYCNAGVPTKCENGVKKVVTDLRGNPLNCNTGTNVCMVLGGRAQCVAQSECELCNGLFSMFATPDKTLGSKLCSSIPTCYMDYTTSSVDKYNKCQDVSTCYDYKSEFACNQNKCNVPNCKWNASIKFGELGIGACRPENLTFEDCTYCGGYSLNNFFGSCTKESCKLFGQECYFHTQNGCDNKRDLSCNGYEDEQACTGGSSGSKNFKINNSWDPAIGPYEGDNKVLRLSSDELNFTYCFWDGSSCFKDGDGDNVDDCDPVDLRCQQDFSPPKTSIFAVSPQRLKLDIDFSLVDDKQKRGNVFHYKIVPIISPKTFATTICYPDGPLRGGDYQDGGSIELNNSETAGKITLDLTSTGFGSGDYKFCYYGEDGARNFEPVNYTLIKIDAVTPELTYTITNNSYNITQDLNGEDYVYLSNVNITVSTQEVDGAYCNFYLINKLNELVMSENLTSIYINKTTTFSRNYTALEDGDYTFHGECIDMAGNYNTVENQTLMFTLEADKHITNLSPQGTFGPYNQSSDGRIAIDLYAETNSDADCKYSLNPDLDYTSMTSSFSTTHGTIHTKRIYYPTDSDFALDPSAKIWTYYVKCRFVNQGNKEYGNNADTMTFAVDYDAPKTIFLDGAGNPFEINSSKWYTYNQLKDVKLKCVDQNLYLNNLPDFKNFAAGCGDARFRLERKANYNSAAIPTLNNGGSNPANLDLPEENNIFVLHYGSIDALGNQESNKATNNNYTGPITINVDDESYTFNFSIRRADNGEIVDTVTWGRRYYVYFESTKQRPSYDNYYDILDENLEVGYYFGGNPYLLTNITRRTSFLPKFKWYAELYIPQGDDSFKNGGAAQFYVKAIDSHNMVSDSNNIDSGKEFTIDTSIPDPAVLDPIFENGINSYEDIYPNKFNEKNGVYYTNDKHLFVTGYSTHHGIIRYYLRNMYTMFGSYDQSINANATPKMTRNIQSGGAAGTNTLIVDGDVSSTVLVGRYLLFSNKVRTNYTFYKKYYNITEVTVTGADELSKRTTIKVSPNFELNIEPNQEIQIYDKQIPNTWFGLPLDLNFMNNTFFLMTVSAVGNKHESSFYDLFYENYTPTYFDGYTPLNESATSSKNVPIFVKIEEIGTGLEIDETDDNKLLLNLNGESVDYEISSSNETYMIGGYETVYYTYNLSYLPVGGFEDNNYTVEVIAKDLAMNALLLNWSFKIDSSLPSIPNITFDDPNMYTPLDMSHYSSDLDTWFMNKTRNFTIKYNDALNVNIDKINLYKNAGRTYVKDNVTICNPTSDFNEFHCTFKTEFLNLVSDEEDYALKIFASKILDDGPHQGNYTKYFTVDRTAPNYTLSYDNTTHSGAEIIITAIVTNQEKVLDAYISIDEIGQSNRTKLTSLNSISTRGLEYLFSRPFDFSGIVENLDSKDYNFTFEVIDLAGNKNNGSYFLRIDNEPTTIVIDKINVTTKIINKTNALYNVNDTEIPTIADAEENAIFRGNALNIFGHAVDSNKNGMDIKRISISKRDRNGNLIGDVNSPQLIKLNCSLLTNELKDCISKKAPTQGKFNFNEYLLPDLEGQQYPNYLLFEVEDDAENLAYYTLIILSDNKKPDAPDIDWKDS